MNYLDGLNAEQLDAVYATEGPVRVLAGAGTGKTKALTARYCYLADLLGIDPGSVLCVTFTNKAAAEMKQRIRSLLGDFDLAYICTFHSFCVRMLKEDIHVLNYPANFILLDEEDQADMLQKVYSDMGLTLKELPIRRAVDYIGRRKGADDYIELIEKMNNEPPTAMDNVGAADRLPEIYMRYIYEQKKTYALDFDDIIVFAHHILVNYPDIRNKWQQRMQYVMVDEFQDVSPRQYEIARILSGMHRNLFIVGDPDQTIYTWRGADVNLILGFDKMYPDANTIVLSENYRSTPQVLNPANRLISHNECRYPKALNPVGAPGVLPRMYHARNEKDEASWIAANVARLIEDGKKPSEIAILYRAHHVSRPVEDALMKSELQYVIFSGTAFYQRREVKDVLSYLRMLTTADDLAFLRTHNTPSRGIGRKKLDMIRARAQRDGTTLYEALIALLDTPEMRRTEARKYVETIESCRKCVDTMSLGDLLQLVLDRSGYEEMLRGLSEWERLDNLAELKRAIDEAGHDDDASLDTFLSRAALISNMDRSADTEHAIRMMTVHTAKGMEFDCVFVCGLCEGQFPSKRSSGPDDIEEERRLAYVAVTRAKSMLFLSDSEGFGHDRSAKAPSRFIYEMGLENLLLERPMPVQPVLPQPMAGAGEKPGFKVGSRVGHPVFGLGTIIAVDSQKQNFTIQFDKITTTRNLRFGAPLDLVKNE